MFRVLSGSPAKVTEGTPSPVATKQGRRHAGGPLRECDAGICTQQMYALVCFLTRPPSTLMEASNTDTTTSRSNVRTPDSKLPSRVAVASRKPSPSPITACMSRLSIIVSA